VRRVAEWVSWDRAGKAARHAKTAGATKCFFMCGSSTGRVYNERG